MPQVTLDLAEQDIATLKSGLTALGSSVMPLLGREHAALRDEARRILLHCDQLAAKLNAAASALRGLDVCPVARAEPVAPIDRAASLIAAIREAGKKPRSYSGRGMYGAECVACSVPRGGDYAGLPGGYSTDSLGMGTIVYWRGVPWPRDMEG